MSRAVGCVKDILGQETEYIIYGCSGQVSLRTRIKCSMQYILVQYAVPSIHYAILKSSHVTSQCNQCTENPRQGAAFLGHAYTVNIW